MSLQAIKQLDKICREWGGKIELVDDKTTFDELFKHGETFDEGLSESPATSWHGLNYNTKTIYAVNHAYPVNTQGVT